MKQLSIFLFILLYASAGMAQTPNWLQSGERERNYPNSTFITGFTPGNVRAGESKADAEVRLRKDAQANLTESVLVRVKSEKIKRDERIKTQATGKEENEQIQSFFESTISIYSNLELTGVNVDSYTDDSKGLIYAFAYVNRYELTGYYKGVLTKSLQTLESTLNTAKELESSSEKVKAREQYKNANTQLIEVELAQDVLLALDPNASLQIEKTINYRSEIIKALVRLAQGVHIYIESREDMFGKSSALISNKVKSILSKNGCSFIDDASQADFILKINASARKIGNPGDIVFCYADVEVELKKAGKTVYQEELPPSQETKGGGTTYENAARDAFEKAGKAVAGKLTEWVKN